jgi:hypothetical protein
MTKYFNKNKLHNIYKFLLFLVFSALFLPQTFILNEDVNLILAYEVDPGSIIVSINNLFNFPYYNMFNGYHTTAYGWTYASLTFLFLLPFKIIFFIFKIDSISYTVILIRFFFYLIGLFSAFILFRLCRKVLGTNNLVISFFIVILYIFSPFSKLFYFLHPETTGILFTFLAVNYLLDYENKSQKKFYYYSLICLVLATLSKQQFFISSFFLSIFLIFLFFNKNKNNFCVPYFFKEITKAFLLSLLVFFLVHPYAFLMPLKFIFLQGALALSFSSAKNNINFTDALILWINLYKSHPLFLFLIILNLLNIIIIFVKKHLIFDKILNIIFLLIIFFSLIYFSVGNKANISFDYFQAIYAVIFFQLLFFLKNVFDNRFFNKSQLKILIIILLCIYPLNNFNSTVKGIQERFSYKEGLAYKSYEYIKENLSINDKIAHDHHVAIPFSMKNISCHYWHSCTNYNRILDSNPNYIAFLDPLPVWGWSDNLQGKALKQYAEDKKMKLVKTINDKSSNSKILIFKLNNL